MSVTVGMIEKLSPFNSGNFSVKLNGTPTGTQISPWNPAGTYAGSDAKIYSALLTAFAKDAVVKIYGTETGHGTFTSYENIQGLELPGA